MKSRRLGLSVPLAHRAACSYAPGHVARPSQKHCLPFALARTRLKSVSMRSTLQCPSSVLMKLLLQLGPSLCPLVDFFQLVLGHPGSPLQLHLFFGAPTLDLDLNLLPIPLALQQGSAQLGT